MSALMESRHELLIDALRMSGAEADEGNVDEGYSFTVLSEGVAFGSSDPVLAVVRSLWGDGSSARIEAYDNAETAFKVRVRGVDHQAVAAGVAALRNALPDGRDERTTAALTWRPADGHSPASVRTILVGRTEPGAFVDVAHLRVECVVTVRLTCAPHVRSAAVWLPSMRIGCSPVAESRGCAGTVPSALAGQPISTRPELVRR